MPTRHAEHPRHVDPAVARRRALRALVPPVAGIGMALAMVVAGSSSLDAPAPLRPDPRLDPAASRPTSPPASAGTGSGPSTAPAVLPATPGDAHPQPTGR